MGMKKVWCDDLGCSFLVLISAPVSPTTPDTSKPPETTAPAPALTTTAHGLRRASRQLLRRRLVLCFFYVVLLPPLPLPRFRLLLLLPWIMPSYTLSLWPLLASGIGPTNDSCGFGQPPPRPHHQRLPPPQLQPRRGNEGSRVVAMKASSSTGDMLPRLITSLSQSQLQPPKPKILKP